MISARTGLNVIKSFELLLQMILKKKNLNIDKKENNEKRTRKRAREDCNNNFRGFRPSDDHIEK
jgi:hypothetical protein